MNSLKSRLIVIGCALVSPCSHAWATDLPFSQPQTGTISSAGQSIVYSFSANANDSVDFTISASGLSPRIRVYKSDMTLLSDAYSSYCNNTILETAPLQLPANDTYKLLVSACGNTATGNYTINMQRINNPTPPLDLPLGPTANGKI